MTDTEMLDCMIESEAEVYHNLKKGYTIILEVNNQICETKYFPTAREAIQAAMRGEVKEW